MNSILRNVPRRVDWLHIPVPKSRIDAAYFAPLRTLEIGNTVLYLGLLHAKDDDGTKLRIEAASKVIAPFGLAAECGLGRSSKTELDSILEIAKRLSGPAAQST